MQIPVPRLALAGMLFEIEPFEPFPEFVAGPLNAGSFGPNPLDGTFGPEVVFQKAAPTPNSSPRAGFQFFGEVEIDAQSGALSVSLRDIDGAVVYSQTLEPWQPA